MAARDADDLLPSVSPEAAQLEEWKLDVPAIKPSVAAATAKRGAVVEVEEVEEEEEEKEEECNFS